MFSCLFFSCFTCFYSFTSRCWQTSVTCSNFYSRVFHTFLLSELHTWCNPYNYTQAVLEKHISLLFLCLWVTLANWYYIYKVDVLTMDTMRARPSMPFMKQWKWTEPSAVRASWPASMTRWRSSLQTTLTCSTLEATPCGETQYLVCVATDP